MTTIEVAEGAILGALVGDAAGAPLEFFGRMLEPMDAERGMRMVGRGYWRVARGQITDDGELALCLMHALKGRASYDPDRAAQAYRWWYSSRPFDIGTTTSNGIEGGLGKPKGDVAAGMREAAAEHNTGSKSNGSLMRIAPLGVWSHRLEEADAVLAARADSELTHPNDACQVACAVYVIAIRHLVFHAPEAATTSPRASLRARAAGALDRARDWASRLGNEEVIAWLSDAEANRDPGYEPQQGFVRYGFTHAFRHLALGTSYRDSIYETLLGGGDTDTNACIVGGLVGALHGVNAIPESMRTAVLTCDTEQGRPRPPLLQTRVQLPGLIHAIVA